MPLDAYAPLELLKEGVGLSTYRGQDARGRPVTVKVTDLLDAGAHLRLLHESRVLGLDVEQDEGRVLLVAPYHAGETLRERLQRGPTPLKEWLTIARSLAQGLARVHASGVVHRDLKPENIILGDDQAHLIDFGLARTSRPRAWFQAAPAGTPLYMAPEQAGLLPFRSGEHADLYSLGLVLYECLSGKPAFQGQSINDTLRRHLDGPPPTLRPHVPTAVDDLLAALLRPDPRYRYGSAQALAKALEWLESALERHDDPVLPTEHRQAGDALLEPVFVDRVRERERLAEALERAQRGERVAPLAVAAPSGGGKSRLLEETALLALKSGYRLFRGQAVHRATQPFESLRGIVEELLEYGARDSTVTERVKQGLAGHAETVVAIFPTLAPLLSKSPLEAPQEFARERLTAALNQLIKSLGRQDAPALVLLEDAQWADPATQALLQQGPWENVVLLAAFRSEEVPADSLLRSLETLELEPLQTRDLAGLAQSMAGQLPAEAAQMLAAVSSGNPFVAVETVRGLVDAGVLKRRAGRWHLESRDLTVWQSSRRGSAILAERVERLSPAARRVLSVAALLGRAFDLEVISALVPEPFPHLEEARRRHLLWERPGGGGYQFAHDRLRELFLKALDPQEQAALHERAASFLEQHHGTRHFEIASHLEQAGLPERALPYALEAGREARARLAHDVAEAMYRLARRTLPNHLEVEEALGSLAFLDCRHEQAREHLLTALQVAPGPSERARIECQLAWNDWHSYQLTDAEQRFGASLASLAVPLPTHKLAIVADIVLHFLGLRQTGQLDDATRDLLGRTLDERASLIFMLGRPLEALWGFAVSSRNLDRPSHRSHFAQVAVGLALFGNARLARLLTDRLRRDLPEEPLSRGKLLGRLSVAITMLGELEQADAWFEEGRLLLERLGERWDLEAYQFWGGLAKYFLGDLEGALEGLRPISVTSSRAQSGYQFLRCLAGPDTVSDAILQEQWGLRDRDDPLATTFIQLAMGVQAVRQRRWLWAAEILQDATTRIGSKPEGLFAGLAHIWRATACREAAQAAVLPEERERWHLEARREARKAVQLAEPILPLQPAALREAAWAAHHRGHPARAQKLVNQALEVSRRLKMRLEEALCLQLYGKLGRLRNWPGASEAAARAASRLPEHELDEPQKPETLSLAVRFEELLATGRRLAAAASPSEVFRALLDGCQRLLQSQAAAILNQQLEVLAGVAPVSRQLVELTFRTGEVETLRDQPHESVILAGLQSAVCAPIPESGLVLYAVHRGVGDLFGTEERHLVQYLCGLAGAALERARSEERFRLLFEGAVVGLALEDPEGRLVQVNPTFRQLIGGEAESLGDVLFPEDRAADRAFVTTLVGSGRREVRLLRRDGAVTWVALTTTRLPGHILRVLSDRSLERLEQIVDFQEHERQLLVAELHDGVSQDLVALLMQLQLGEGATALALGNRLSEELRGLMTDMRSPVSEGEDLLTALEGLVDGWSERLRLDWREPAGRPHVGGLPAYFGYRLFQEALANVFRHSGQDAAEVSLEVTQGEVRGRVRDQGQGFDPAAETRRFGLRGMRLRAQLAGGTLHLVSAPGAGTTVEFTLPL